MSGANLQHLLAMILYMAAVIGIGVYFAGRANKNAESYFLGGRSLGPWVTAFSAEASDKIITALRNRTRLIEHSYSWILSCLFQAAFLFSKNSHNHFILISK